jgi:hypothetical protein
MALLVNGGVVAVSHGGRVVGFFDVLRRAYVKTRSDHRHFCVRHRGFGIQRSILDFLLDRGATAVYIPYVGAAGGVTVFRASPTRWALDGVVDTLRPADGEQVFLPVDAFDVVPAAELPAVSA